MEFKPYEYEITVNDIKFRREYIIPNSLTKDEVMSYVDKRIKSDEQLKGFTSYKRIMYEDGE